MNDRSFPGSSGEFSSLQESLTEDQLIEAEACIANGELAKGQSLFHQLQKDLKDSRSQARIWNGLGVIAALQSDHAMAIDGFEQALRCDPSWHIPIFNRDRWLASESKRSGAKEIMCPETSNTETEITEQSDSLPRIAIISLLFNWPSTGGGTVHTAELARFLHRAGYPVRHFSFRYDAWQLGQVQEPVDWPLEELLMQASDWNALQIQHRLKQVLRQFSPDAVIVTDSWSMKPILAEACEGYPTFLRLAAQECLCPLNNVRLLQIAPVPRSCPRQQLATPEICIQCVTENERFSGGLHRRERALAGFGTPEYSQRLRRVFAQATGILAVNPLIAEACKPFAQAVHVVPSGFDPARFPIAQTAPRHPEHIVRLLFAGLVQEPMKGFHVLLEAARQLWQHRQDFQLVITDEPLDIADPFVKFVGWQSQAHLPQVMQSCDIVICPTIAEEALGRTAVEGMAAGRPVIASAIGGLSFTVLDEATGLLFPPGDSPALSRQIERLLDDSSLRRSLGIRGRERFEKEFTWSSILDRHYRPLFDGARREFRNRAQGLVSSEAV